jgi:hypothetical protein
LDADKFAATIAARLCIAKRLLSVGIEASKSGLIERRPVCLRII